MTFSRKPPRLDIGAVWSEIGSVSLETGAKGFATQVGILLPNPTSISSRTMCSYSTAADVVRSQMPTTRSSCLGSSCSGWVCSAVEPVRSAAEADALCSNIPTVNRVVGLSCPGWLCSGPTRSAIEPVCSATETEVLCSDIPTMG